MTQSFSEVFTQEKAKCINLGRIFPKPLSAVLFLITSNWKQSKLFISGRMDSQTEIHWQRCFLEVQKKILMQYGWGSKLICWADTVLLKGRCTKQSQFCTTIEQTHTCAIIHQNNIACSLCGINWKEAGRVDCVACKDMCYAGAGACWWHRGLNA